MLKEILPLIPKHKIYIEPFFGGGAVYWAKERSDFEVINDVNSNIINFYEVLKHDFFKLRELVETTLHSRDVYKCALTIYSLPQMFGRVQRAWAFWVVTNQGFATKIGTWGYDRSGTRAKALANKIEAFKEDLEERMRFSTIECNDAVKVIKVHDSVDSFFYIDPPYIESNQGHYGGYEEKHFVDLLNTLEKIEGKFLLSSYPSSILDDFIKSNKWHSKGVSKALTAGNGAKLNTRGKKIEVLTANYKI